MLHVEQHGLHEEPGHHQAEAHQHLIAGRGLRAERLTQEMKDNQQAHHRRHRQDDGGEQREQGEGEDNGPRNGVAAHAWPSRPGSGSRLAAFMAKQ